jgi:hypothetical protein
METKKIKTVNTLIALVQTGELTAEKAAKIAVENDMGYGMKFYSCQFDEEVKPFWAIKEIWQEMIAEKTASVIPVKKDVPKMVKCSCGCTIPKNLVMSASLGSSCPNCYDRMSD